MSCTQHDTDLLTGGCITDYDEGFFTVRPPCNLPEKCEHGVHIPADERPTGKSSYCGVCNPNAYGDEILHRTLAKKRIVSRPEPVEREIDAAEFMEQPISARLASTREFFA